MESNLLSRDGRAEEEDEEDPKDDDGFDELDGKSEWASINSGSGMPGSPAAGPLVVSSPSRFLRQTGHVPC